jgi:hypothetical protein
MKILSFDIGIRNLAFCLYDSSPVEPNQTILQWDVIDILSFGESQQSYNTLDIAKKWKKEQFVKWFQDNHIELPKTKKDMLEEMKKIIKVENKGNKKEKNGIDLYTKKILQWLESRPDLLQCDIVALENQPCMKNPIMKTIQTIIYTYYYYFGVLHGQVQQVKLVSATNKLKIKPEGFVPPTKALPAVPVVTDEETEKPVCVKKPKTKAGYAERKSQAIAYMKHYLIHHIQQTELTTFWESHGKKDDLADCFLQAVYVSKHP